MGINVDGLPTKEILVKLNAGEYDSKLKWIFSSCFFFI
jgi:hypothetical protein